MTNKQLIDALREMALRRLSAAKMMDRERQPKIVNGLHEDAVMLIEAANRLARVL